MTRPLATGSPETQRRGALSDPADEGCLPPVPAPAVDASVSVHFRPSGGWPPSV